MVPVLLVDTSVAVAIAVGDHEHHDAASAVAGGAVYDTLVGATAVEHGLVLATRDRRALQTYRRLDVMVELLG